MFVGRQRELNRLSGYLERVRSTGRGEFVGIRGRRQVGKSTLVEEFTRRAHVPSVYFAASKGAAPAHELGEFVRIAEGSDSAFATAFGSVEPRDWSGALRLLAQAITEPVVVVLDELPWLTAATPELEGVLQTAWDRHLSNVPVLLLVLGSEISMMERLGEYGRPLYQRMREMVLEPLTVADTAKMLGLSPAAAFDAQVVSGGFPRILQDWAPGEAAMTFVARQLAESTSPLVVIGERVLNAEFPPQTQARELVLAIGAGETTFTSIGRRTGINQGSLSRTLASLRGDLRVITARRPLSGAPSRLVQYAVEDLYLRFWLQFVAPQFELILRGRGDVAAEEITRRWIDYRGRAVEPLIRGSIERLLPDERFGATRYVGSYWTRTHDVEVDLVGSTAPNAPAAVTFVGSVKWRDKAAFARADLLDLAAQRSRVPGADSSTPLVAVARTRVDSDADISLVAEDLLDAWR
ncbi:MAG: ATP-binding protein [Pseudonocardia sp.]|nr:ATP-binding protein [Pseudonocardia sp.]